MDDDEKIIFKFSLKKEGFRPSGDEIKVKYPIIAVLFKESGILEIRYDSINGMLVDDYKQFYKKNIGSIKAWFSTKLGIKAEKIDIYDTVKNIYESGEVNLGGQDMRFSNGSKACLEVGSDNSYTLPLLGELKEIIKQNEEEFNQCLNLRQLLETWIKGKEDEADCVWICLCWPDAQNRKTYEVRVRFVFDYFEEDETLLYHYSGVIGMERMNDVTRTIIKHLPGHQATE